MLKMGAGVGEESAREASCARTIFIAKVSITGYICREVVGWKPIKLHAFLDANTQ